MDVVQRLEIGKAEQAARLLGGAIDLDIELHRLSPPRKMPVSRLSRARSPASFALSPQRSKRQESSPHGRDEHRNPDARRRRHDPHLCRSEEHTSELQSLMRISYAVFCLTKTNYI